MSVDQSANQNSISAILDGLNVQQRLAVEAKNGPNLIIAGAGSGKTRVLTSKIAYLIADGVPPYGILALTFTNKAAKEMKERIARLVGGMQAEQIWAGTFHSIFARILRIESAHTPYSGAFSIYDAEDQLSAIKSVMTQMGISPQTYPPAQVRARISNAKNQMISPAEFMSSALSSMEKNIGAIYEAYEEAMKRNNAMDFDDLLLNMLKLFDNNSEVLRKYQQRFRYILVDEYQDTNRAQYMAVKKLAMAHQNLSVVGDDAQSIYRWRGADIRNILEFQNDYPYAKTFRLEQNYRSTRTILAAADAVIKNNKNQLVKTLWTDNPQGDAIEVAACADDNEEALKTTSLIKENLSRGYGHKDIAVLYRTNAQSLVLENYLRKNGIGYQIIGGISFFKRKEVKDVIAYLRILVNPRDNESLLRVINEPPRGIGKTTIEHLTTYSRRSGQSILEAFESIGASMPGLQQRAITAIGKFYSLIEKYRTIEEAHSYEAIASYIQETGLLDMYKDIGTDDANDRYNNIAQLLSDIDRHFDINPGTTLDEYLQQAALITDADDKDTDSEKVTLMTLHTAKGLEYPVIFIVGLEQGVFPIERQDSLPDEMEEERRLFYVGITRAMEKLYLSFAQKRLRFGQVLFQAPSIFLKEIPEELLSTQGFEIRPARQAHTAYDGARPERGRYPSRPYDSHSQISHERRDHYSQVSEAESYSQIPQEQVIFRVGDKVNHSKFGPGTITALKGTADQKQAVVDFKSIGKKILMLKFANLQKVS